MVGMRRRAVQLRVFTSWPVAVFCAVTMRADFRSADARPFIFSTEREISQAKAEIRHSIRPF